MYWIDGTPFEVEGGAVEIDVTGGTTPPCLGLTGVGNDVRVVTSSCVDTQQFLCQYDCDNVLDLSGVCTEKSRP